MRAGSIHEKERLFAILSAFAFAAVLVVNGLAVALPLNGKSTGELADAIPNLFVPAGITFSIWSLIYVLLGGYIAVALLQAFKKGEEKPVWESADAALFLVNAAANIGWIFAWHWQRIPLSFLVMLAILGSLIAMARRVDRSLEPDGRLGSAGRGTRFLLSVPIRVYLGWICVATIANATALLVSVGWDGFGIDPRAWTVFAIAAGLAVELAFAIGKRQIAAPLVFVWAFAGIAIKRLGTDADYSRPVWIAALVAALIALASVSLGRLGGKKL
jgi:hypothetical protein